MFVRGFIAASFLIITTVTSVAGSFDKQGCNPKGDFSALYGTTTKRSRVDIGITGDRVYYAQNGQCRWLPGKLDKTDA